MASKRGKNPISKKNTDILRALYHLNPAQRISVLKKANPQLIRCICECALNILKGNVSLEPHQKSKLKRHAHTLRRLANAKAGGIETKRRIIVQKGNGLFLTTLLVPIIEKVLDKVLN